MDRVLKVGTAGILGQFAWLKEDPSKIKDVYQLKNSEMRAEMNKERLGNQISYMQGIVKALATKIKTEPANATEYATKKKQLESMISQIQATLSEIPKYLSKVKDAMKKLPA